MVNLIKHLVQTIHSDRYGYGTSCIWTNSILYLLWSL